MLISCSYNNEPCDKSNFYPLPSFMFKNCYAFNYGKNYSGSSIPTLNSKAPDMNSGLKLKLFVGSEKSRPCWNPEFGILVVVNNRTAPPLFVQDGMYVQAGTETNLLLNKVVMNKLPSPFSNCVTNLDSIDGYDSEWFRQTVKRRGHYRQKWCILSCASDKIDKYLALECLKFNFTSNFSLIECLSNFSNVSLYYDECSVECPIECDYSYFNVVPYTASFPSSSFASFLLSSEDFRSKFGHDNVTIEQVKESVVSLNVYFNSIDYQQVTEVPDTDIGTMLGNFGGQLGLFLGVSFLSFAEIFEVLIELCMIFFFKTKKVKKIDVK
jgi:hypothetical protein